GNGIAVVAGGRLPPPGGDRLHGLRQRGQVRVRRYGRADQVGHVPPSPPNPHHRRRGGDRLGHLGGQPPTPRHRHPHPTPPPPPPAPRRLGRLAAPAPRVRLVRRSVAGLGNGRETILHRLRVMVLRGGQRLSGGGN